MLEKDNVDIFGVRSSSQVLESGTQQVTTTKAVVMAGKCHATPVNTSTPVTNRCHIDELKVTPIMTKVECKTKGKGVKQTFAQVASGKKNKKNKKCVKVTF